MAIDLALYKGEVEQELAEILAYWIDYSIDHNFGGFFGQINNENIADPLAIKGSVLNSRILWAFSAAYNKTKTKEYLPIAQRAFDYISTHFIDKEYGGIYWSVDYLGNVENDRKQIYGLAFCIYAMSEFYKAVGNKEILETAIDLFSLIEKYSFDNKNNGYLEAFTRAWHPLDDMRLSRKDANEKKTMNTHLHIIEAYANLYEVWPDKSLKAQVENLLELFQENIIDKNTGHLNLFFDEEWNPKSTLISYGHDIEAAWLLQQSAQKILHTKWANKMKALSIKITDAATKGLDKDAGLWYEYDLDKNQLVKEKHSWPQAEAMVGFMNAYQITHIVSYLEKSLSSWQFIKLHIKDHVNGEWFWGINADNTIMPGQDKVGFWKCPYHNTRACLEIIDRIADLKQISNKTTQGL